LVADPLPSAPEIPQQAEYAPPENPEAAIDSKSKSISFLILKAYIAEGQTDAIEELINHFAKINKPLSVDAYTKVLKHIGAK
jgi:hypothetical protein